MLTTSGGNPRRRHHVTTEKIKLLEQRMATFEVKEELTLGKVQSVLRISKLLSDTSNNFKGYHFTIVNQIENDDEAAAEQRALGRHDIKVMLLINCLAELIKRGPEIDQTAYQQQVVSNTTPSVTDDRMCLIDRQLESLEDSVRDIRKALGVPGIAKSVLANYLEEIASRKAELQGLNREILSLNDYRERKEKASRTKQDLFNPRVVTSHQIEESSNEKDGPLIDHTASRSSEATTPSRSERLVNRQLVCALRSILQLENSFS